MKICKFCSHHPRATTVEGLMLEGQVRCGNQARRAIPYSDSRLRIQGPYQRHEY